MKEPRKGDRVRVTHNDHETDPPVGEELDVLGYEPETKVVLLDWHQCRWPMFREHVEEVAP